MTANRKLTVGSLFAGIGGLELGLEMTGGFKTVWQVENNEYATRVLEKHWSDARRWNDVRTFPPKCAEWGCDVICGGFPCQPFSTASAGKRVAVDRWPDMLRIIEIIHPSMVLAENVSKAAIKAAEADLATIGYKTSSCPISADDFGADHRRRRWWLLAHANHKIQLHRPDDAEVAELPKVRRGVWGRSRFAERCRISDGIPSRVDRLRCLGNAVVPQVAEWIGRRILEAARLTELGQGPEEK